MVDGTNRPVHQPSTTNHQPLWAEEGTMAPTLMDETVSSGDTSAELPSAAGSVLVVDDEERARKLVAVALRRAGYEVTLASDGTEALERVGEATPDLILSDVMMPGVDGLELLRRLRAEPSTRSIPVILLTGKGAVEDVVAG